MTAAYIAFHAAERPKAVAIINNGRSITYAEFARDIRKFTHALRALELPQGASALIDCEYLYFSWLLRLAFEQLRVVSATVALPDRPDALRPVRNFDIVLSGKSLAPDAGPRRHPTTIAWLESVLASASEDEEPAPEKRPDDPIRIVLTSGTTGMPKRLLYTRRIHETSIARTLWFVGFTRQSRYLLAMPSTVAGPTACIRAGGTIVIEERMPVGQAIAEHGVTHTTLPPFMLKRVLDELPGGFAKRAALTILSFGARISHTLRERALARLATDLCDMYGSNEAGFVSSIRGAGEIGTIWPGARVEVVDENDQPLPFGEAGQIRVRTDYMLHEYLDYPQAAGQIFKDGWFYAGDVGILHEARRLQVIGRTDDVLNLGWQKIAPEVVEDLIRRTVTADDVGVCSAPNADGIDELCIALSNPQDSDEELLRRITDAFRGLRLGRFYIAKVADLPRTANGKLQRKRLREMMAPSVRARSQPEGAPQGASAC